MNVWILAAALFLLAYLSASRGEDDLTGTVRFKRSSEAQHLRGPQEVLFGFRVKRQIDFSKERYESRERRVTRRRQGSRENSREFSLAGLAPALSNLSSGESEVLGIVLLKSLVIKVLAAIFIGIQVATANSTSTSTSTST